MKKILVIFFILFCQKNLAQNINTHYDTCQYLTQYEGEWLYTNNQDTIRIFLRYKRDYSIGANYVSDNLYGWHEYKQGNIVIESDYANRFMYLPFYTDSLVNSLPSINLLNYNCTLENSNKLQGYIKDILQSNESHALRTHMWGGGNFPVYMLWKQSFSENHGAMTGAFGMTLPREFILIKQ